MKQNNKKFPQLSNGVTLVDSHCHLDMKTYDDDLSEVVKSAKENGVENIISIGIDLPSSKTAVAIAKRFKGVKATIGVHPHDVDSLTQTDYDGLRALYRDDFEHIVGYGEIGLDYVKKHSEPQNQIKHFRKQLEFAKELKLPVIIHNREADSDTLEILSSMAPFTCGGILHCFSGDYDYAKRIMDLGMLISIPGIVTFKNATTLQEVALKIPLDKMLVETDGPFLSPHPFRGKRNEPVNTLFTAAKIADLRGISIDDVAMRTTENALSLFGLHQ